MVSRPPYSYRRRVLDEGVAVGHQVGGGEGQPGAPVGCGCTQAEVGEGCLEGRIAGRERVAFTAIAIGAILISASLMSDPAWRPAASVLLAISVAGAVAYLLLGAALKHHHSPDGLYERIFLGLELL
jgi:hypothetical protein